MQIFVGSCCPLHLKFRMAPYQYFQQFFFFLNNVFRLSIEDKNVATAVFEQSNPKQQCLMLLTSFFFYSGPPTEQCYCWCDDSPGDCIGGCRHNRTRPEMETAEVSWRG